MNGNETIAAIQNDINTGNDSFNRKIIQQRLVFLLHAQKCIEKGKQIGGVGQLYVCTLPFCTSMKDILNHITTCETGKFCPFPHCTSSIKILDHWKTCIRIDCNMCSPLKQMFETWSGVNNNTDGFDEQERRFLIQNLHFLYPTYGNPVTGCLSSHGQQLPLISMNNSEPGPSTGYNNFAVRHFSSHDPPPMQTGTSIQHRIEKFLLVLKNAKSPEETQKIIKDLNKDPQLMQAFIAIRNSQPQLQPKMWQNNTLRNYVQVDLPQDKNKKTTAENNFSAKRTNESYAADSSSSAAKKVCKESDDSAKEVVKVAMEELDCCICFKSIVLPVLCKECQKIVGCKGCITTWFAQRNCCPCCRSSAGVIDVKGLDNLVKKLREFEENHNS